MAGLAKLLNVVLSAFMGNPDNTNDTIINIVTPDSYTGSTKYRTTINLPPGGGVQTVNLASLFPAASAVQFVSLQDVSNPTQPFTVSDFNPAVQIPAGLGMAWTQNGGTPPTVHLSNPSGSAAGIVEINVVSN